MRRIAPVRWAAMSLATLLLSTATFGALASFSDGPGEEAHAHHGTEHGATGHAAMHGPAAIDPTVIRGFDAFTPAAIAHVPWHAIEGGKIPDPSTAKNLPNQWSRFIAVGDEGLDRLRAEGHFRGSGTSEDPYIIEKFRVTGEMVIQSTSRAIVLREGIVEGQLRLNYIGPLVHVHHVRAEDLRVNENIQRSGDNTGGLFHDNRFDVVGQIRHFTGEFFENTVGPRAKGTVVTALGDSGAVRVKDNVVFNFDGFHGADVHHNVFHGVVDIKLHGHNHADCFLCEIHDHADPTGFPTGQEGYDAAGANHTGHDHTVAESYKALGMLSHHSVRYHSLLFRDNQVQVGSGIALRYHDTNHAGDDQTANSEPNEYLEDPHVHYQDITFARNKLVGGGFQLELFNAHDDRHILHNVGALRLIANDIHVRYHDQAKGAVNGIELGGADGIELLVEDNTIRFEKTESANTLSLVPSVGKGPVLNGIRLNVFRTGNLTFSGNTVTSGQHGIFAQTVSPLIYWELLGNDFRTKHEYRGERVETVPYESSDKNGTQRERSEGTEKTTDDTHHGHGGH